MPTFTINSLTDLLDEGGPTLLLSRAAEAAWLNATALDGEEIHKSEVGGVALQQVVGPEADEATGADAPAVSITGEREQKQLLFGLVPRLKSLWWSTMDILQRNWRCGVTIEIVV